MSDFQLTKYYLENGQTLDTGLVERGERLEQRLAYERQEVTERPARWEDRILVPTTKFLHMRHHIKLLERHDPILYHGRLTFAIVAACTGLHPTTVSHWYQTTWKHRLNPELLILCQYYEAPFRHAFVWHLPNGHYYTDTK